MSTNANVRISENTVERNGGPVWNKLHSEREEVCEALLKESVFYTPVEGEPRIADQDADNWHKDLLQARLRKIDDALDRLGTGSYGNCCQCGRWIQDTKLDFDPAVAFCVECWDRAQRKH